MIKKERVFLPALELDLVEQNRFSFYLERNSNLSTNFYNFV